MFLSENLLAYICGVLQGFAANSKWDLLFFLPLNSRVLVGLLWFSDDLLNRESGNGWNFLLKKKINIWKDLKSSS